MNAQKAPTRFSIAYFPPAPPAYFNQPKALAARQDFRVFIGTNIIYFYLASRTMFPNFSAPI
jgi:hypothetical protein